MTTLYPLPSRRRAAASTYPWYHSLLPWTGPQVQVHLWGQVQAQVQVRGQAQAYVRGSGTCADASRVLEPAPNDRATRKRLRTCAQQGR
jgi:hypothetical protein